MLTHILSLSILYTLSQDRVRSPRARNSSILVSGGIYCRSTGIPTDGVYVNDPVRRFHACDYVKQEYSKFQAAGYRSNLPTYSCISSMIRRVARRFANAPRARRATTPACLYLAGWTQAAAPHPAKAVANPSRTSLCVSLSSSSS